MRNVIALIIAAFAAFTAPAFSADFSMAYQAVAYSGQDDTISVGFGETVREARREAYRQCFMSEVRKFYSDDGMEEHPYVTEALDWFSEQSINYEIPGIIVKFRDVEKVCLQGVHVFYHSDVTLTLADCIKGGRPYLVSVAIDHTLSSPPTFDSYYQKLSAEEKESCIIIE